MEKSNFELAQEELLSSVSMNTLDLEQHLAMLLNGDVDFGELYVQSSRSETWVLEDGIVKDGSFNLDRGVGVRAVTGEKTGFAYAEDIDPESLKQAVIAARSIARSGKQRSMNVWKEAPSKVLYPNVLSSQRYSNEDKVDALCRIDKAARSRDSRVREVTVSLSCVDEKFLVIASDGTLMADVRPLVRVDVSVIAEESGRIERGHAGGGGRMTLLELMKPDRVQRYADEAVRSALLNLSAIDAPAGAMPVVLGPGWPGVLLHEAVGHGLEGDFNRKGTSAYAGQMGEKVASSLCTIVDDATLSGRRGSLNVDDEGTSTQRTVLVENGILKGYLQDKLNAKLMNSKPTGNGRRQSYAHLPMPRMTNTFLLPGQHDAEEIIGTVENGLYAVNFGGGQVDITSGKFVFSMTEAYLIKNGRLTEPVKGATLIGNGPQVMRNVSMVGNDLQLDEGVGVCGKEGQSVPVGVGQPTLKIDEIIVGGTRS